MDNSPAVCLSRHIQPVPCDGLPSWWRPTVSVEQVRWYFGGGCCSVLSLRNGYGNSQSSYVRLCAQVRGKISCGCSFRMRLYLKYCHTLSCSVESEFRLYGFLSFFGGAGFRSVSSFVFPWRRHFSPPFRSVKLLAVFQIRCFQCSR